MAAIWNTHNARNIKIQSSCLHSSSIGITRRLPFGYCRRCYMRHTYTYKDWQSESECVCICDTQAMPCQKVAPYWQKHTDKTFPKDSYTKPKQNKGIKKTEGRTETSASKNLTKVVSEDTLTNTLKDFRSVQVGDKHKNKQCPGFPIAKYVVEMNRQDTHQRTYLMYKNNTKFVYKMPPKTLYHPPHPPPSVPPYSLFPKRNFTMNIKKDIFHCGTKRNGEKKRRLPVLLQWQQKYRHQPQHGAQIKTELTQSSNKSGPKPQQLLRHTFISAMSGNRARRKASLLEA